jgi:hypothetical protein
MTRAQALKIAQEKYGAKAYVYAAKCCTREYYAKHNSERSVKFFERYFGKMRYTVGVVEYGCLNCVKGTGLSWEEALQGQVK